MTGQPISRRTFGKLAATVTAFGATVSLAGEAAADSGSGGGNDNLPPFDFTDAFYRANGVDSAQLVGRPTGRDTRSVIATPPDGNHGNVRSLFTLPAYDTSGKHWYLPFSAT